MAALGPTADPPIVRRSGEPTEGVRRAQRDERGIRDTLSGLQIPLIRALSRARADRFDAMVHNNRVTLLRDGAACLTEMLVAIREARFEVSLEMYWFGSDATGRRFADALSSKAREGVAVQVIYDSVGSFDADDTMFEEMRAAGCIVHEYNPIAPWRKRFDAFLLNKRDHRKILVVDQIIGFTGGVNLGDPWAAESDGGGNWRDDVIRIEGVAALQLREVFLWTWRELGEERATKTMNEVELRESGVTLPSEGSPVRVLTNQRHRERATIRRSYLREIRGARSNIFMSNSYFVPDRAVRVALAHAVKRGVDVKVLVPGESDVAAVYYASRRLYEGLMRDGIELYEWHGTILHSKTATIDDRWCTVGTYNFDHRSWRFNLEVNVSVEDAGVAAAMARCFREDIAHSGRLDRSEFRYRPLGERALEHLCYLFRRLL